MELQPRRQRQTDKLIKRNENHDSHRAAWRSESLTGNRLLVDWVMPDGRGIKHTSEPET